MENKSEFNALDELFHQKMTGHRIPVYGDGWGEIERRLVKHKTITWLWRGGSIAAAAAVVAILMMVHKPIVDEKPIMVVAQQNTEVPEIQSFMQTEEPSANLFVPKPAFTVVSQTEPSMPITASSITNAECVQELPVDEEKRFIFIEKKKEIPQRTEKMFVTKKQHRWTLAALLSTTGSRSDGFSQKSPSPVYQYLESKGGSNAYAATLSSSIKSFSNMSKDDFTSIRHLPALSVGLMARKNLGNTLAVESGIIYTYLESYFEWPNYDAHQSLHYIGIPVNVLTYIWNSNPHWQIYLSGGVTVEKCVRAIYTQNMQSATKITKTIVKSSVDNLQWSLNGALGINYKLGQHLGIFFEPRFGYHFNNQQPINMRTEWPVSVGVNIGIHFQL